MQQLYFITKIKRLSLNRKYFLFSLFYGLTTLIIPLAVQFLVNNLVLAGIWINTISFLIIIGSGLIFSRILQYSQVIITEFLQREIFVDEIEQWKTGDHSKKSYYYFEIINLLKSYSTTFTSFVEMGLVIFFGLLTILMFHPGFLILPIVIGFMILVISRDNKFAILTSIEESNRKYNLYYLISGRSPIADNDIDQYLIARNRHFQYVKKNTLLMAVVYVACQIYLLGLGTYLIQSDQLSIGQLVSAEIILSGILGTLIKLPKTMESLYDFETSKYKITKALEGGKNE